MRTALITLLTILATSAFAEGDDHDHDHDDHGHEEETSHKATLGDVELLHAWTTETDDDTALIYVEIENGGDAPVTLIGAESDIAASVELVGFQLKDGADHYEPLGEVAIAAGSHLDLEPRGVAFLMTGLTEHLHEDEEFEFHVIFDTGEAAMIGQVEAADATQHSHAGHNH